MLRLALTAAIGCLSLAWAVSVLPRSEVVDGYRDIEHRLLRSETFDLTTLRRVSESDASRDLSVCDTHSQRALLLTEMPLAEAALRSGNAVEFDRLVDALEIRSRRIVSCAPRDSFAWLVLFSLEVLHGRLTEHTFDLLATSYENSPNEAWISVRRIVVAMPIVLLADEPLRKRIIKEFQLLVRNRLVDDAARCYAGASQSARSLLLDQIGELDPTQRRAFSEALLKLGS
jgi:hypothetical protein